MKLGAEPKKVGILVVLVGLIGYGVISQMGDSTSAPPVRPATGQTAEAPVLSGPISTAATGAGARTRTSGRALTSEFRPRLGAKADEKIDPAKIDPELRLDLLAKVQAEEPVAAGRNLFQFGPAPVPPVPQNVPKIPVNPQQPARGPQPPQMTMNPPPVQPSGPPPTPQAPPITLRYFGYKIAKADGRKEAFLMDGEEIIRAAENEVVKQRYRIVRIALTSVVIEDTQFKSTQTIALQELQG